MSYISATMPKSPETKRIEVHLMPSIVKELQRLAELENRSLKNYIETLLQKHLEDQNKKTR